MEDFLQLNSLTGHLLLNVSFQESSSYSTLPGSTNTIAETFKICVREHNAHAQVNAGFNLMIVHDQLYRYVTSLLLYRTFGFY